MLRFPVEDTRQYQGKILFQKFETEPPSLTDQEGFFQTSLNILGRSAQGAGRAIADLTGVSSLIPGTGFPRKTLDPAEQTGPSPGVKNNIKELQTDAGLPGQCLMYLPAELNFLDGSNVNNVELGIFGSLLANGLGSGDQGVISSLASAVGDMTASIVDFAKGGVDQELFAIAAGRMTQASSSVNSAVTSSLGVTPNPNIRAIFQGVNPREFALAFEMHPKSREEQISAKNVIKYFRTGLYPESIRAGGISAGFKMPNKFQLTFKHGENNIAFKFKNCFLISVQTTFNGQNMAFTPDGNFSRYLINLTFREEQTIDKQDVMEGF